MKPDHRALTDEQLAAAMAGRPDGDAEHLGEELFRRYRQRVYVWCHGYCHDAEEAVDLAQEIFIKVFAAIGEYEGRARLSTWMYTVARNHCLGRLANRGEAWRKRLQPLDDLEVPDLDFARGLRDRERQGRLDQLLERARTRMGMKDEELQAFVLHYRDGVTVREITRLLGCGNATGARTLIQNAQRKFRRLTAGKEYSDE